MTIFAQTLCGPQGSATDCHVPQATLTADTLRTVAGNVFIVIGLLSVIFLIVGGFRYAISGGDPNNLKQAKETVLYSIIGLVVSILAFTLVAVVGKVAGGGSLL